MKLFKYHCVDCPHIFYLGDEGEDSPSVCPFCGSTEILSDGEQGGIPMQDSSAIDVTVSGVIESLGISALTRRIEVGTVDWTPDMILGDPDISNMIAYYRGRNAQCIRVGFEFGIYPEPLNLLEEGG